MNAAPAIQIGETVAAIVRMLVQKQYQQLTSLTQGIRLSSNEIGNASASYRRTLIEPPPEAYNLMEVIPIRGAKPPAWSIVMPLWTQEEGRSDLSLQLTLIKTSDAFRVEIDDIHVL